ncbi:MAG: 50S ribosomal protein L24 [Patescibacteria group bacterium]
MKIKKGDEVTIIAGKDKSKTGQVTKVFPKADKLIVSGLNINKFHQRPRKSGEKGQLVDKSMPIHVSNVKLKK